jgi:hypothetical protein
MQESKLPTPTIEAEAEPPRLAVTWTEMDVLLDVQNKAERLGMGDIAAVAQSMFGRLAVIRE